MSDYFGHPLLGQGRRGAAAFLGVALFALVVLGLALVFKPSDADDARAAYLRYIKKPSSDGDASAEKTNEQYNRSFSDGIRAAALMDWTTAEKHFREALAIKPNTLAPWEQLAAIYSQSNDNNKIFATLNQCVLLNSQSPSVYRQRSILFREKGNISAALADAKEAARLAPLDPLCTNQLYFLRILNGETEAVRKEVKMLASQNISVMIPTYVPTAILIAQIDEDVENFQMNLRLAQAILPEAVLKQLLRDPIFDPKKKEVQD